MSWYPHLWDQYDSLSRYSQISIVCFKQYVAFLEECSEIDYDYYLKLKRLSESHISKLTDVIRGEPEIKCLSWYQSLIRVLISNKQLSNQHALISSCLKDLNTKEIKPFISEMNSEIEEYLGQMKTCQLRLRSKMTEFKKAKEFYEKSTEKDRVSAERDCETKLKIAMNVRKKEYSETLPAILQNMQQWDNKRSEGLQMYIQKTNALKGDKMIPVMKRCLIDIDEASNAFNSKKDGIAIIQMYKSGYLPPTDSQNITFREYIDSTRVENRGTYDVALPDIRSRGKMARELQHLQPYQQWRVCNRKLANYNKIRSQNNSTLAGINRMLIALKGNRAATKDLKKQRKDVQENLRIIAKKEPKYYNIKCNLEKMYGPFSIDIKPPPTSLRISPLDLISKPVEPDEPPKDCEEATLQTTPPPPPTSLPTPPPDLMLRHDKPDKNGPSSDLRATDSFSTTNMANGEPFLRWISTKGKCKALYPFEITANGEICISNQNEFWVAEEQIDAGWNTAQKVVVEDNKKENVIPLLCLEKCTLLEHRFLVFDQPVQ